MVGHTAAQPHTINEAPSSPTTLRSLRIPQAWVAFAPRYNISTLLTALRASTDSFQTVKKSAKVIIERYYPKLTLDFETNKRICDEIAIIASKRLRNKVDSLAILVYGSTLKTC